MLQHGQAMENFHIQVNHVASFVRAPTEWIALNKALANAKVAQPLLCSVPLAHPAQRRSRRHAAQV